MLKEVHVHVSRSNEWDWVVELWKKNLFLKCTAAFVFQQALRGFSGYALLRKAHHTFLSESSFDPPPPFPSQIFGLCL